MPLPSPVEYVISILSVRDMSRSLAFYVDVLGFHKDFGNDDFAGLSREGNPATQAFQAPLFCAPR